MEGPLLEIVGVVGDVKQNGLDTIPSPEIYQPFASEAGSRASGHDPRGGRSRGLVPAIRGAVSSIDRNLPIQRLTALEHLLGASLARRRFGASLLAGFAALAVALACVGLYGLLSYWVSVRESEIAIRLALGARRAAIVRWTSAHALRLVGTGAGFGLFGAWAASRGLQGLVFGTSATSPITLLGLRRSRSRHGRARHRAPCAARVTSQCRGALASIVNGFEPTRVKKGTVARRARKLSAGRPRGHARQTCVRIARSPSCRAPPLSPQRSSALEVARDPAVLR